jgi:hypothetical protein
MATKIAFLVLAHGDPHHLARLCASIGPYDDIFLHVDRKTPDSFFAISLPSNVQLIQPRVAVQWADVSIVHATLSLIENALAFSDDYLRLVLLSGACYPIKPVDRLREHFMERPNENEIRYVNLLDGPKSALRRISRWHFRRPLDSKISNEALVGAASRAVRKIAYLAGRSLDEGFERYFPDLVPYFGSQWWALTPAAANYALERSKVAPELLAYMRHCWAPDEVYFHTVLGNSEYATSPEPYTQDLSRLGNLHIVQRAASKIFQYSELPEVMASDAFFVRKLASGVSDQLADAIDQELLNSRERSTVTF